MATITCYKDSNCQPTPGKTYTTDQPDLTEDFPNGIGSAEVRTNPVTVFQYIKYEGESRVLKVGRYDDKSKFPPGGFQSLKV